MKNSYSLQLLFLLVSFFGFSQDINIQNGLFYQDTGIFYDSGGDSGNYQNNENFTMIICPTVTGSNSIILDFTEFSTEFGADILSLYDGLSTSAPLIGSYSGTISPGTVQVSASVLNPTGCITITFVSNASITATGWAANISTVPSCQTITASINTIPEPISSGMINIAPNETVTFFANNTTFSVEGAGATYNWYFEDTNTNVPGQSVPHLFTTVGTYTVVLTAVDASNYCSDTETILVNVLGDNMDVDQNSLTVEEMVTDILIKNSACAQVSNITFSTGTNHGRPHNGIGYFYSNGSSFPFGDGILMVTGDASEARGPNDFAMSGGFWPGDADLSAITGGSTHDATIIEFDFVPFINNISFEFLMASEEYDGNIGGTFECSFSDAFAFLLTDSLGNTTNLAVLPGTDTPILVTNIHPENNGCAAVNEQYFGGYTDMGAPPTSFNGRTEVFKAQSPVVPGDTYHIKLVIADASDSALNSGVFLKGGSFDIGGDLGQDVTIASGNAICDGGVISLDTGIASLAHIWYKDGIEIIGETLSTLDTTEPGVYSVDVVFSSSCQSADSILIEYIPLAVANTPNNLSGCSQSSTSVFNLTQNDAAVLGTQSALDFVVTYHLTQNGAETDDSSISDPVNYSGIDGETIYARVEFQDMDCYDITSFTLNILSEAELNPVSNLEVCDDNNDGLAQFDLESQTLTILGTQPISDFLVTYHASFNDANTGTNALSSLYTNTMNMQPIYVRVEAINNNSICANVPTTPTFYLTVNPELSSDFDVFPTCDGATVMLLGVSGGIFTFNPSPGDGASINPNTGEVTNASLNTSYSIEYAVSGTCPSSSTQMFTTLESNIAAFSLTPTCDGANANITGTLGGTFSFNPIPGDMAIINPSSGNITNGTSGATYTVEYIISGTCPDSDIQSVTVITEDDSSFAVNPTCDGGTATITGMSGGSFVFNPDPMDGATINPMSGDVTGGSPNTSYTIAYTTTGVCPSTNSMSFTTLPEDDSSFTVNPTCDGGTVTITGISGGSFAFNPDPMDGAILDTASGNVTNGIAGNSYTIAYTTSGLCPSTSSVTFDASQSPTIMPPTDFELCDDIIMDGLTQFDLSLKNDEISDGDPITSVSYYLSLADATMGFPQLSTLYTNVNPYSQVIFARVDSINSSCFSTTTLTLTVNEIPMIFAPSPLEQCDLNNDGLGEFMLTDVENDIVGNIPNLILSYHETIANAQIGMPFIDATMTYNSMAKNIYVRGENVLTGCYKILELGLVVLPSPVAPVNIDDYVLCDDNNDGLALFDLTINETIIFNGQMDVSATYYETQNDAEIGGVAIPNPTSYTNISSPQTIYVRVDDNTSQCYTIIDITLKVDPLPLLDLDETYILCVNGNGGELLNTGLSITDYMFEWTEINDPFTILGTDSGYMPTQTGTYNVLVTKIDSGCQNTDTTTVIEGGDIPIITATVTTEAFVDNNVIEVTTTGSGIYEYSLDGGPWQSENIFSDVSAGEHTITARHTVGCGEASTTITVLDYPLFFTPNDDGYNDTWNISGITAQTNAKIYIFDRYGKLLKLLNPAESSWNGFYNGNKLPSNDYWFTLEYDEPLTGNRKEFKAHFTLKR